MLFDSWGQDIATVAVVGYTNAGKSTLVSALSNSYLYCDDRLFETVDPKLSSVILPSGRKVLLSDTVGFISDLPVQLVEAFHATLEEVVEADLLVYVLDSSAPNIDEHQETVLDVEKIGVPEEKVQNMIEVWNKIDVQEEEFDPNSEDYISSSSGGENDCVAFDLLSGNDDYDIHDTYKEDTKGTLLGDFEEVIHDQRGDQSNGWLSSGEEENSWVDYYDGSVGYKTTDDKLQELSWDWRSPAKSSQSQLRTTHYVNISAITGVGLQNCWRRLMRSYVPGK